MRPHFRLHHFGFIFLTAAMPLQAGESCGSKEGWVNQLTARILIPDQFPPETPLLRSLVSEVDLSRCEKIGKVDLSISCQQHDRCYDERTPKTQCDKDLQSNWVRSCGWIYFKLTHDHFICKLACENFVKLMSEAQRYESGDFCPSCDAYNNVN